MPRGMVAITKQEARIVDLPFPNFREADPTRAIDRCRAA